MQLLQLSLISALTYSTVQRKITNPADTDLSHRFSFLIYIPCPAWVGVDVSRVGKRLNRQEMAAAAFSSLSEMSTRALVLQQALGDMFAFTFGQVSSGWCVPLLGIWKVGLYQSCPSCTPQAFCPSEVHMQVSALKNVTEPLPCLTEVIPLWSYDNVGGTPPKK